MKKYFNDDNLGRLILAAMGLGIVLGILLYSFNLQDYTVYIAPFSKAFLRLLKMVVVPLVMTSIFMSVVNLGDPKELGVLGKRTILFYTFTTGMAVFFGLILVNLIQPGVGTTLEIDKALPEHLSSKLDQDGGVLQTVINVLVNAIPTSPFGALANSNVLQVIIFSLLLGLVALYHREKVSVFIKTIDGLNFLVIKLTQWIMIIAPFGVFFLTLEIVANIGVQALLGLAKYFFTVVLGLGLHAIFLLILGSVVAKRNVFEILKNLTAPVSLAFSSASSAATLPVSLETLKSKLKVNEKTADFVLPLGATVNMDGTALYESVAVIFIAQVYGINLDLGQQVVVFFTATLAAVGAASIPGAGLITMSLVLNAVGLPLEGIGLILAVDRILDMFRTAVNVLGDCTGALILDKFSKDLG